MSEARFDLSPLLTPEMRRHLDEPTRFKIIMQWCGGVLSAQDDGRWVVQFKAGGFVSGPDRDATIDQALDYLWFAPRLWPLVELVQGRAS